MLRRTFLLEKYQYYLQLRRPPGAMVDGRPSGVGRDWDPDTRVSRLTRPEATSWERRTRHVSSAQASRREEGAGSPQGMVLSRMALYLILQVQKSTWSTDPGPRGKSICAAGEGRPWWEGLGEATAPSCWVWDTHPQTSRCARLVPGAGEWWGPTGWKSLKRLEIQELEEWI